MELLLRLGMLVVVVPVVLAGLVVVWTFGEVVYETIRDRIHPPAPIVPPGPMKGVLLDSSVTRRFMRMNGHTVDEED